MTAVDLICRLRAAGATLAVEDERLKIDAPRGVMTAELQAAVREHKSAILRLLASKAAAPDLTPLPVTSGDGPFPVALAQERIWLFQELQPESTTYLLTQVLLVDGPLDHARLEASIRALVERHEALRCVLTSEGEGALNRPMPVPPSLVVLKDLSHLSADVARQTWQTFAHEQQRRPFDLKRELPLRVFAIRWSATRHELLLVFHHVAIDGLSLQIFLRELAHAYAGTPLPALPARFRDYAMWERQQWAATGSDRLAFWREYLAEAPPTSELPPDHPRGATPAYTGGFAARTVGRETQGRLREIGLRERASPFMLVGAALGAAIHRFSGQRDLLVGFPVSGRQHPDAEALIGMFVNQVALRLRIAPGASFHALLRDVRESALEALAHQSVPFSQVVQDLQVPHVPSRTPLFQILLNVTPASDLELPGVDASPVKWSLPSASELASLFDAQAKFDLTLYARSRPDELQLGIVFNRDLFEQSRIEALLDLVSTILERGTVQPDVALDTLIVPPRPQLVPTLPAGAPQSVPERLHDIAHRSPERPAVTSAKGTLSYGQLGRAAEQVARIIHHSTAARPGPIGIFVPHDGRLASAILGTLTSGRPYVPLDPRYPRDRLSYVAAHSRLAAVLSVAELAVAARDLFGAELPIVDLASEPPPDAGRPPCPAAEAVAYHLYTSGSTGLPKAVVQSHHHLLQQGHRYARALGLTPDDRLALTASISFDASLMDLFGALHAGAAIEPVDIRTIDLALLPQVLRERRLTVLHVTPTIFRTLARVAPTATFPSIRLVVLGGEAVRLDDVAFFAARFGAEARLFNLYGASEHSFSLGGFIDRGHGSVEVPLGLPLDDVEPVLLAPDGRADPVCGELAIRSAHNALGYLENATATAHAFLPDPEQTGRTLYRTGDVVRRRPDGFYVFLHRVDNQLKVRGHRIEPREIEATLQAHPEVSDVAVYGILDPDGEVALAACAAPRPDSTLDVAELRSWCRRRLPEHMIPTEWIIVPKLPKTPSGKIDRKSLPRIDPAARPPLHAEPAASATEQTIAGLFAQVLARPGIGRNDNFFHLGGHSLSAVRLVALLRSAFSVDLPLRCLFDSPTVAELARRIQFDATQNSHHYVDQQRRWQCLIPAQPHGSRPVLFLITGYMDQDDTLRILSNLMPHLGSDQPLCGVRPRWLDGQSPPYASVDEATAEFVAEMRAYQPRGPYHVGGDCVGGVLAVEIARRLMSEGEEVDFVMLLDTERPSALTAALANLRLLFRRVKHVGGVLRQLLVPTQQTRRQLISDVIQRRRRRAQPARENLTLDDWIYQQRLAYRRSIYNHRLRPFAGHITLIVSEDLYRMGGALGWRRFQRGRLEVHQTPGDHWTMRTQYSRELGQLIRQCLDRAAQRRTARESTAPATQPAAVTSDAR